MINFIQKDQPYCTIENNIKFKFLYFIWKI